MPAWVWWLLAAAGLAVAEMLTLTFVLGMLAVGAAVSAVVAGVGGGGGAQAAGFAATSAATLLLLRPVARRHLHVPLPARTGVAALVGRQALVLQQVDARQGLVKIGGETWTARAYDQTQVIPPGTAVDVLEIDGATALVHSTEVP